MQPLSRAFGLVLVACACALVVAACSQPSGFPEGQDPIPEGEDGPRQLLLLGDGYRTVAENEEHAIQVRYVRHDGSVIPNELVDFATEGDVAGATLTARTVQTDADGLATVTLRAGAPTRLTVSATAEAVPQPTTVTIDVVTPTFGELQVTISYGGSRPVRAAEVGLFTNITCDGVVDRVPSASEGYSSRPGATVTFGRVETGVPVAVFALGIDRRDYVAAEGCLDVTLTEPRQVAELVLEDLPELYGGAYDVEERFDVTEGVNDTLDDLLAAMTGLSSDPAQFIVNFVAESDAAPDWLRSAIGNPIMGALVTSTLRDALEGVEVPGLLVDIVDLGAELDAALSGMMLEGELLMEEPDEFGSAAATHRITRMVVPVDGRTEARTVRAQAELSMPVTPAFSMPEHNLDIALGSLVETVLEDILLPRLPGEPHSVHGLMTDIFDCDEIAHWLVGDDSLAATLANAVCDAGVLLLADEVQGLVLDLFEYDQLTLSATATLSDSDEDYDRDSISEGTVQALWTGPDGQMRFPGSMTGTRRDDRAGRDHPIRPRLQSVF